MGAVRTMTVPIKAVRRSSEVKRARDCIFDEIIADEARSRYKKRMNYSSWEGENETVAAQEKLNKLFAEMDDEGCSPSD